MKLVCKSDEIQGYPRIEIDIPKGADYLWIGRKHGQEWEFLGSIDNKPQLKKLIKLATLALKAKRK